MTHDPIPTSAGLPAIRPPMAAQLRNPSSGELRQVEPLRPWGHAAVARGSVAYVEKVIYDRAGERLVKQWLEDIAVIDFYPGVA